MCSCGASGILEDSKSSIYSNFFLGLCTPSRSLLHEDFVDDKDLFEGFRHDEPSEPRRGFGAAGFGGVSLLAADAVFLCSLGLPIDVVGGRRWSSLNLEAFRECCFMLGAALDKLDV